MPTSKKTTPNASSKRKQPLTSGQANVSPSTQSSISKVDPTSNKPNDINQILNTKNSVRKYVKRLCLPVVVTILLALMAGQMLFAASIDGDSSDEQIHILSGYTTLTQAHVLFDPEHPFLAKTLAAIPLLFVHPHVPTGAANLTQRQAEVGFDTYKEANRWGYEMLFSVNNNPDQLLFLTRAIIALLTLLLALTVFLWTKSLFGKASALAALTIVAFEPTILAHGHLANDDTVATLFFLLSIIAFYAYLKKPTYKTIAAAGVILGLGLITKYSLLLLGPTFVIITALWLLHQRRTTQPILPTIFKQLKNAWLRYIAGLIAIFILAWGIIWLSYGALAIINPSQNPLTIVNITQVSPTVAKIAPYILPVMYLKGAAILFDPNSHGRDGYLLGACYKGGLWNYFLVTGIFKLAIPFTLLFLSTAVLWWRKRRSIGFTPIIFLVSIAIYLAFSMASNINIGFRHVLPIVALLIVMAAYPYSLINWRKLVANVKELAVKRDSASLQNFKPWLPNAIAPAALLIALISIITTGAMTFPNYLSYYNILAQEPRPIPYISADSNVDWGQGTTYLQTYMTKHRIAQVAFDNFTGTDEAKSRGMSITNADPNNRQYKGYIALSRSVIIDHYCTKQNDWGWLIDHQQPIAIINNTINLYKLE